MNAIRRQSHKIDLWLNKAVFTAIRLRLWMPHTYSITNTTTLQNMKSFHTHTHTKHVVVVGRRKKSCINYGSKIDVDWIETAGCECLRKMLMYVEKRHQWRLFFFWFIKFTFGLHRITSHFLRLHLSQKDSVQNELSRVWYIFHNGGQIYTNSMLKDNTRKRNSPKTFTFICINISIDCFNLTCCMYTIEHLSDAFCRQRSLTHIFQIEIDIDDFLSKFDPFCDVKLFPSLGQP